MSTASRCVVLCLLAVVALSVADEGEPKATPAGWKAVVARKLPLLGHRNWVVIADSAYPAQSRPGIETVVTGADQLEVVGAVLEMIRKTGHTRPNIYLDAELPHVDEDDARGVTRYRDRLKNLLGRRPTTSLPHEEIITKLDVAAAKFIVLILKTDLKLPYTSVFLELDCGYWSEEAEKRLRQAMKKPKGKD